jgi:hypothetical protein
MPWRHSSHLSTLHMVEEYETRKIHIILRTSVLTGDEEKIKRRRSRMHRQVINFKDIEPQFKWIYRMHQ